MKAESDPITDDEWLLRRVRIEKFRTDKLPIISPNAFEPRIAGREPDTDGISLYREACLTNPSDVLANLPEDRRRENGVVRLSVRFLRSIGLEVHSMPVPGILGHVVLPRLNAADYSGDKGSFTALKLELAEKASTNVAVWPGE